MIMTACLLMFLSLMLVFFFASLFSFCCCFFVSWITTGLCQKHPFIFQSLLYVRWAVIPKVISQMSWLMLDKHFFYRGSFSEVTEWHDWSLNDQWFVLKNVRFANITLYFPESTGILFEENFRMPDHVDCSLQLKAFFFPLSASVLSVFLIHSLTRRND